MLPLCDLTQGAINVRHQGWLWLAIVSHICECSDESVSIVSLLYEERRIEIFDVHRNIFGSDDNAESFQVRRICSEAQPAAFERIVILTRFAFLSRNHHHR